MGWLSPCPPHVPAHPGPTFPYHPWWPQNRIVREAKGLPGCLWHNPYLGPWGSLVTSSHPSWMGSHLLLWTQQVVPSPQAHPRCPPLGAAIPMRSPWLPPPWLPREDPCLPPTLSEGDSVQVGSSSLSPGPVPDLTQSGPEANACGMLVLLSIRHVYLFKCEYSPDTCFVSAVGRVSEKRPVSSGSFQACWGERL